MRPVLAALAAALIAGPALAQAPAAPKVVTGAGEVKAIDAKAGSVTLHHGPIPAINWPAMTMKFKAPPEALKGLKPGQAVTFTLDPASNELTSVTPK